VPPKKDLNTPPFEISAIEKRKKIIQEHILKMGALLEKNRINSQKKQFSIITGYTGNNYLEAKKKYHSYSLQYHPDHGGDTNKFIDLKIAWKDIESTFEK
jgi:hypothetical protein